MIIESGGDAALIHGLAAVGGAHLLNVIEDLIGRWIVRRLTMTRN